MLDNKNETICLNMKNNSKNSTPVTESVSDESCEFVEPSISKCETNFEENSNDSSTGDRHCDENKICLSDNITNSEKTNIKRKSECLEISDTININVRNKMSNSGSDGFSDNCSVDEFEKMSDCQKTKLEKDNDTNIKNICNEKIKATISKVIVSDSLMSTLSNFRIYKEGKSSNANQECTENHISRENTDVINNTSDIRERKDNNNDDESKFKKPENCMTSSLPQNVDLKTNASHDQISLAIDGQLNKEFQLSSKAIDASNIKVDASNISSSNSDSSVIGNTSSLVHGNEDDKEITTHKKKESFINDDNILPSILPLPLLNENSNCTSSINSRDKITLDIQNPKVNNIENSITLETDQNNSSNTVLLKMPESKSLVKKDEYRHTVNLTTDIKSSHEAESQISLKDCGIINIAKGVSKSPVSIDNTDLSNNITEYSECKEGSSINFDSINNIDMSEKEITEKFQGEKGPSINPDSVKTTDLSKNKIAKYSQGEENTPANHDTIIITGLSKNETIEYSPGEEDTSINNTVLSKNEDTNYSEGEISSSVNNIDLSKNDNTEYSKSEENPSINNTDLSKNEVKKYSEERNSPSVNNTDLVKNKVADHFQSEEGTINSDPNNKILLSMNETRDEEDPSINPKNLQSLSQPNSKPENDSACTVDTESSFPDDKSLSFAKENHVLGTNSSGQACSLNNTDVCNRSAVKQSSKEYEVNLTSKSKESLSDSKVESLLKLNSEIKIIESGPKEEMKISSTDPKKDINCLRNDKTDITANKFDCSEYLKIDSNIYNLETQNSKFKVLENDICKKVSLSKNKENIVNSPEYLQKASVDCNMDVCVNSLSEEQNREFDPSKDNKFKENVNILNSESEKQGSSSIKSNPNEIVSKTDVIDISQNSRNPKTVVEMELAGLGMESNSISGAHDVCKKEENETNETNVLLSAEAKVKEICSALQFENGSGGESVTVYNETKNNNTSEDILVHKQNQERLETSQFIENNLPHTSKPSECSSLCSNGVLDSHNIDKKNSDEESLMMDDTDVESNFEGFTSSDQLEYSTNFYQSKYNLKRCEVNLKDWGIKDNVLSNFSKELMLDKPNFRQVKRKLEDMLYDSQIEEENISKRIKNMRQEKKNVLKNIEFQVKKIKKKYGFTK